MKIYSEKTNKYYKTVAECEKAEKVYDEAAMKANAEKEKLVAERKNRAKEVEDAYRTAQDAQRKYVTLRNDFIRDYGSFHMTFSNSSSDFDEIFDTFFSFF